MRCRGKARAHQLERVLLMSLAESVLAGERLALARLITLVENGEPEGLAALDALFPFTGKAHFIGVTGAPGTGKSSLVNHLALHFRKLNRESGARRVGIVAVDPTSPFTGGALLGDRVRMRDLTGDPGIFIRSMASRGTVGGLARTTAAVAQVMDAAGFDLVLIETVGAGQSEVDIARLAHTTLVVEAPGLGDDIQAIKAGILEIADILVVNKADLPGSENTFRALRSSLEMGYSNMMAAGHHHPEIGVIASSEESLSQIWAPPIIMTRATSGEGVPELAQAILSHREYLEKSGEWQKRNQTLLQNELDNLLQSALMELWRSSDAAKPYSAMLDQLNQRKISPYQAVETLLKDESHGTHLDWRFAQGNRT